jgi:hypothetical protein
MGQSMPRLESYTPSCTIVIIWQGPNNLTTGASLMQRKSGPGAKIEAGSV